MLKAAKPNQTFNKFKEMDTTVNFRLKLAQLRPARLTDLTSQAHEWVNPLSTKLDSLTLKHTHTNYRDKAFNDN